MSDTSTCHPQHLSSARVLSFSRRIAEGLRRDCGFLLRPHPMRLAAPFLTPGLTAGFAQPKRCDVGQSGLGCTISLVPCNHNMLVAGFFFRLLVKLVAISANIILQVRTRTRHHLAPPWDPGGVTVCNSIAPVHPVPTQSLRPVLIDAHIIPERLSHPRCNHRPSTLQLTAGTAVGHGRIAQPKR